MAVTYNELVVLDFTEKEIIDRGTNVWGANYVFSSGGLQNDITLIARKFDFGFAPAASGNASLGASGTPFQNVFADRMVTGGPDASGAFYIYGDQYTSEKLLYSISVDSGVLVLRRATELGNPQLGD